MAQVKVVIVVQGGVVTSVDSTEPIEAVLVDHDNGWGPEWLHTGTIMRETWGMYAGEADETELARESEHLERRFEIKQ